MIYLFNSASRPLYRQNVLEVLAQPRGMLILHRYRAGGAHQHVDPRLGQAVQRNSLRSASSEQFRLLGRPEDVLLIFVDRYPKTGYVYHPLRRGLLHTAEQRDDRLYFRVDLGDFIAPVQNPVDFTASLRTLLAGKRPPTQVPGQPDSNADGQYAILAEPFPDRLLVCGESAWQRTVDALATTRRMLSTAPVVFFRCELEELGRSRSTSLNGTSPGEEEFQLVPKQSGWLNCRKDRTYELRITYRRPHFPSGSGDDTQLRIETGRSLQVLGRPVVPLHAEADDFSLAVACSRYTDDGTSFISLVGESATPGRAVVAPQIVLPVLLRERLGFYAFVVGALLLFALGSALLSVEQGALPSYLDVWLLRDATGRRVIGLLGQAAALFLLFRLTGKKPV